MRSLTVFVFFTFKAENYIRGKMRRNENMRAYQDYIKAELLVLIPVLYILGEFIKKTDKIDNKYIPALLGISGIFLSLLYVFATEGITALGAFTAITQGILVAGAAVYAYEFKDHIGAKEDEEDD